MRFGIRLLREDGSGEGGGAGEGDKGGDKGGGDFLSTLPEDVRSDPSLQTFKDVGSLAKSYVHARSMIGSDKIAKPSAGWNDEQWNSFYNETGRPTTADGYQLEKDIVPEGVEVDEDRMTAAKKTLHGAGLNNAQTNQVLKYYFGTVRDQQEAIKAANDADYQKSEDALRTEWGEDYAGNMDVVKGVLGKFGDEQLVAWFKDDPKIGNSPLMLKLLHTIGRAMLDDSALGAGDGIITTSAGKAAEEIKTLETDQEFMKSFLNKQDPGHTAAVDRMLRLQTLAAG